SSLIEQVYFGTALKANSRVDQVGLSKRSPSPARVRRPSMQFHYVGGLNPEGDNFLALKLSPNLRSRRIAMMGPGTLLTITKERGVWKQVRLRDGASGWAHGNWIKCCKVAELQGVPSQERASPRDSCERLWYERNAIWHRHKYCFRSARGRRSFDNTGCFRTLEQARAKFTETDRHRLSDILSDEKALGCR
ncbi:MAG: YARHG domain-containing protein, partial [Hyphomicrobiaceae bacterium]